MGGPHSLHLRAFAPQAMRAFPDLDALLFLIEYEADEAQHESDPIRSRNREPFDGKRR